MGAFVGWDASTRTVLAQKGDKDVVLPIGSRTAMVNGAVVQLDVPAMIMSGTTMVPLRFVGEALGAGVQWNAATRTVEITSAGTAPGGGTTSTGPSIQSFTHNSTGWLIAGNKLKIVMKGTPGGTATFEIPGVTDRTQMNEVSAGQYESVWTVPADANNISGAGVVGQLTIAGKSLLIQAGTPISIDTTPPVIGNTSPNPDSSLAKTKPGISATYDDGSGSGINTSSVKLTLNGTDVTNKANVTSSFVSYSPASPLEAGVKTIVLSLRDKAGNSASNSWAFTIKTASQVIKSITYSAPANAGPGDVISVRMEGESGGKTSFWFITPEGTKIREQQMQETSSGVYEGEYTIRREDDLSGAGVVGSLTTSAPETFILEADKKLGGLPTPPTATSPINITYPLEGKIVPSPVVIKGTSAPGAHVRLTVEYVSVVLGALHFSGKVADQTVTADEKGNFLSAPVELGTMFGAKDTEYTLKAVIVSTDDTLSEPKVVKFKRK
jgi:hypothetical protein